VEYAATQSKGLEENWTVSTEGKMNENILIY
jgi:hypothetical protein